jgi:hypothetical protein
MPNLSIMDKQATSQIKKFLTTKECKLQVVEPKIHCINAVERAIQIFENHFIVALSTINTAFPLQLWDKLTLKVRDALIYYSNQ